MQIAFDLILETELEPFKLFADSFIVKSIDGSQGVGPNPTDRFRNGIKCGLLIDERGVIWRSAIVTANKSENAVLNQLLKKPFKTSKAVFTDAGFCFKPDAHAEFRKNGIRVITKPKLNTPKKGYNKNFVCLKCRTHNKCSNGKLCINSNKGISELMLIK